MKKLLFICLICTYTLSAQIVSTIAGTGSAGSTDGIGLISSFNQPSHVCADASGNIYVADASNHKIRKITPSGVVSTFAGSGSYGSTDGIGTIASFHYPTGICIDASGNIYVADAGSNKIRKITPSSVVSTFAGSGIAGSNDGIGTTASFQNPKDVCVDVSGNIYVADCDNNKIRKITPSGIVSTIAGSNSSGFADGIGAAARFYGPHGVCVDTSGNIYVADRSNHRIRKITSNGLVSTFAGSGTSGSTDGIATAASFFAPCGVSIDVSGNIYVADTQNNKIRKITTSGTVSTLAGSGAQGSIDGIGSSASFHFPFGVCADALGNIYVADSYNEKIRKITIATSVLENNLESVLAVFPNPTNGIININTTTMIANEIVLVDVVGKTIISKKPQSTITQIDLTNYNSGIYFAKIISNYSIQTMKIIKQ